MNQQQISSTGSRNMWLRALFMLLMVMAYQLSVTLLFFLGLIQFAFAWLADGPNERLMAFGRNLGTYLRQIVEFLTFSTDEAPFPFSDWPSSD